MMRLRPTRKSAATIVCKTTFNEASEERWTSDHKTESGRGGGAL